MGIDRGFIFQDLIAVIAFRLPVCRPFIKPFQLTLMQGGMDISKLQISLNAIILASLDDQLTSCKPNIPRHFSPLWRNARGNLLKISGPALAHLPAITSRGPKTDPLCFIKMGLISAPRKLKSHRKTCKSPA